MALARIIKATLLALLLLVTSQSMAVARGTMKDASGAMVLCTGTGPITVLTDENGQPIGPNHICPDCAMSVMAGLAAPLSIASPNEQITALTPAAQLTPQSATDPPPAHARAPPLCGSSLHTI